MQRDDCLLDRIVQHHDRQAFAELVRRYIRLVYACARRQVGVDQADDLTQAVFCLLWEKPFKVRDASNLAGWLVNATRLVALQWRRTEYRRQRRERQAVLHRPSDSGGVSTAAHDLSARLDEALFELSGSERSAIVMRYLQEMSVDEVAGTIGISPAAVAKRLTRGLDRLRAALKNHGEAMSSESLASAIALVGRASPMPGAGLAGDIARKAVVDSSASAGGVIYKASRWFVLPKWSVLAASFLVWAAVAGAIVLSWRTSFAPVFAGEMPAPTATQPSTPPAAGGLIKVGVTVSKLTAITNNPSGRPFGYDGQTRIVRDIAAPDTDIYPVIEHDSQDDPDLKAVLARVFPGKLPIDGSDVNALKQLDVLAAHEDWMVPDSMLNAVDQAVSEGLPLLNIGGMGWASPGLKGSNPSPQRLTGMIEVQGGYTNGTVKCDLIQRHEILGDFAPTQAISLRLLGMYGILPADATPLMQAEDSSKMVPRGPSGDPTHLVCYPIYISHLGNGNIVGIGFGPYPSANPQQPAKLVQRSIRWLAKHPAVP